MSRFYNMLRRLAQRGSPARKGVNPGVKRHVEVSIGIYWGKTPFELFDAESIQNPVLSPRQVTDARAQIVADPFMVYKEGNWHMFFEVFNLDTRRGEIGLARSGDGYRWAYQQIVLREPFHLSYPHVFEWQDKYYMVPESGQTNSVRIYEALEFPTRWTCVGTLMEGGPYVDAGVFNHGGIWWMFAETSAGKHDTLRLYHADDLMGPWGEHPQSPLVTGDASRARPAGRVTTFHNRLYRFAQDCSRAYGDRVRAFEINELNALRYQEQEIPQSPILEGSGTGWNGRGMHHIDPQQVDEDSWIACVDGFSETIVEAS